MGFITTNIANVPTRGYEWYIMLIEDGWEDDLRETLSGNFEELANRVGSDALVVKGLEWEEFYPRGFDQNVVQNSGPSPGPPLPAILVTNKPPNRIDWDTADSGVSIDPKIIFLPLAEYDQPTETLGNFLDNLVHSLKDPGAIEALEQGDEKYIEEKWAWLNKYVNIKPNFFGFGIDMENIISDIVQSSSNDSAF